MKYELPSNEKQNKKTCKKLKQTKNQTLTMETISEIHSILNGNQCNILLLSLNIYD